ncbi:MAG: creatininase family protein [Candidatus Latescibacterota bacterium]|nr:creatininase family protein [Candidatus Latescibacterota bacterium]
MSDNNSDREVRWERMFPHQLEVAFGACPGLYFPYGLCEPHGPQNALGLDGLKAHGILVRLAREHGGIVAPPDFWHIHEIGGYASWAYDSVGEVKPWMSAVPPWHHFKSICYHIRAAEVLDFQAAILLTGHYGPNWKDLKSLVDLIQPWVRVRLYGLPDFEANEPGFPNDGAGGDHAGKVETSLLWALEPDCVEVDRIPDDPQFPLFAMGKNAAESRLEAGKKMVADEVAWLANKRDELLDAYDPGHPSRLRTYGDVERFWNAEVEPLIQEFETMRQWRPEREPPPERSRWRENWPVDRGT